MFSQAWSYASHPNLVLLAGLLIWAGCESAPAWIPVSDADLNESRCPFRP